MSAELPTSPKSGLSFDVCTYQPGQRQQTDAFGVKLEAGILYNEIDEIERCLNVGSILNPISPTTRNDKSLILNLVKSAVTTTNSFMPRLDTDGIPMENKELYLGLPLLSDLPVFVAAEHDEAVRQHAIFQPASEESLAEAIGLSYYNWRRGSAAFLVLRSRSTKEPLAKIALRRVVPPGVLDVGYVTMPGHRGHHYSALALEAFTGWVFENTEICRIELGIKPANTPSIRTAKYAGYQFESIRRACLSNGDGTFEDEHSYVAISGAKEVVHV